MIKFNDIKIFNKFGSTFFNLARDQFHLIMSGYKSCNPYELLILIFVEDTYHIRYFLSTSREVIKMLLFFANNCFFSSHCLMAKKTENIA